MRRARRALARRAIFIASRSRRAGMGDCSLRGLRSESRLSIQLSKTGAGVPAPPHLEPGIALEVPSPANQMWKAGERPGMDEITMSVP